MKYANLSNEELNRVYSALKKRLELTQKEFIELHDQMEKDLCYNSSMSLSLTEKMEKNSALQWACYYQMQRIEILFSQRSNLKSSLGIIHGGKNELT